MTDLFDEIFDEVASGEWPETAGTGVVETQPTQVARADAASELLPCPFCGGTEFYAGETEEGACLGCLGCEACGPIMCDDEGEGLVDTLYSSAWNRRVSRDDMQTRLLDICEQQTLLIRQLRGELKAARGC